MSRKTVFLLLSLALSIAVGLQVALTVYAFRHSILLGVIIATMNVGVDSYEFIGLAKDIKKNGGLNI